MQTDHARTQTRLFTEAVEAHVAALAGNGSAIDPWASLDALVDHTGLGMVDAALLSGVIYAAAVEQRSKDLAGLEPPIYRVSESRVRPADPAELDWR